MVYCCKLIVVNLEQIRGWTNGQFRMLETEISIKAEIMIILSRLYL